MKQLQHWWKLQNLHKGQELMLPTLSRDKVNVHKKNETDGERKVVLSENLMYFELDFKKAIWEEKRGLGCVMTFFVILPPMMKHHV